MTLKNNLLCLTLLLLLGGCTNDRFFESQAIDSEIIITAWENLESANRTFELICATQESYPCSNYSIHHSISVKDQLIGIGFNKILIPNGCLTAFGPATTNINLGTLSNKTYNVEISLRNKTSKGRLIVNDSYYQFIMDREENFKLAYNKLNRIPANTVWGTVGYHAVSSENLAQSFIDSLQTIGATIRTFNLGEYGHFSINSSGGLEPPKNHGYYFIKAFIFNYPGNMDKLKSLVKNYGIRHGNALSIELKGSKGERYLSWIK